MSRTTQIIAVLFVFVAGFTLWSIIATDPEVASDASLLSEEARSDSVTSTKTIEALINMRNLRLEGRILESAAFQSLVNNERQIIPEPVGRQNPFAPVGSDESEEVDALEEETNTPPRKPPSRPPQNPQNDELFEE